LASLSYSAVAVWQTSWRLRRRDDWGIAVMKAVPVNTRATHSIQRPSLALLSTEPLRAAMEFAHQRFAKKLHTEAGDGHPVVIFPGLGADGRSVLTLREHCRALGYQAMDWGQGFNKGPKGDLDEWLQVLKTKVQQLIAKGDQPATLIGWSLGGLYAREIAKLVPDQVRQVITIGTPFNTDADHTHAGWLFRLLSGGTPPVTPQISQRLRTPPPVPTTSIYSRSDGIVAWQTCRHDPAVEGVQDIEVHSSHIGMGWNRQVLDTVARLLRHTPASRRDHVQHH
jgi:pimeloyl-ACP methyl ester carboxylesterase